MIFNVDNYRIHFKNLEVDLRRRGDDRRDYWASFYAATTGCPMLAVMHFQAELYGMTPNLMKSIKDQMARYGITQVIGYQSDAFEKRSQNSKETVKAV